MKKVSLFAVLAAAAITLSAQAQTPAPAAPAAAKPAAEAKAAPAKMEEKPAEAAKPAAAPAEHKKAKKHVAKKAEKKEDKGAMAPQRPRLQRHLPPRRQLPPSKATGQPVALTVVDASVRRIKAATNKKPRHAGALVCLG